MFTKKTYVCVCHGCGKFHEIEAEFLSTGSSLAFPVNEKRSWSVPVHGCPECMKAPRGADGRGPIGRAFDHGMTAEARARSLREFEETWRERLEERASPGWVMSRRFEPAGA